ncbi:DEAD/DEAH box helicase family protein [Candidatus Epulonipiscium viviparus]|uniref:DEAD/DEAH box helicase family protein n=1 Tax=Candidatus Epulonipiscium viviparus TaxID=420336 RepID=UPI00273813CD|nr:DEAD/DEAH box helicase family protein [Candidatus Epulopiscium viviparus]
MQIKFKNNLEHQTEAVAAVVDLFDGYEAANNTTELATTTNCLQLSEDAIFKNLQAIQYRNGLAVDDALITQKFDIEMETGTGKTYVYLKTIFELYNAYGFNKFVIAVPSIAIKEGVCKSLEMLKNHFAMIYKNIPYSHFVYDSRNLDQVYDFASAVELNLMIINIAAFNKSKENVIYGRRDKMNGMSPIDLIATTRPIVIVDEPQTMMNTPLAKQALAKLNPLCTLNYSATHKEKNHCIYKLDARTAYEQKLVKRVDVVGVKSVDDHNQAYIKLIAVRNKMGNITAQVEIDCQKSNKILRKTVVVRQATDLYIKSGKREVYRGYIVKDICSKTDEEWIDFEARAEKIFLHEAIGDVAEEVIKREQISQTIKEHLDKELKFKDIKVLSLFFIDKVANYRSYNAQGDSIKGKYAVIFEEEYNKWLAMPKYRGLAADAEAAHGGYFAVDKRIKAAEAVYALIMQDKEKLLSLDSKLRFIFSHSALREGWDNPNVFQICTLGNTKSLIRKRQEIGRGMRLCVNQAGERVNDMKYNTLTVIANESYESFAGALQSELRESVNVKNRSYCKNLRRRSIRPIYRLLLEGSMGLVQQCVCEMQKMNIEMPKLRRNKGEIIPGEAWVPQVVQIVVIADEITRLPDIITFLQRKTNLKRKTIARILLESETLDKFKVNPQMYMDEVAKIIAMKMKMP